MEGVTADAALAGHLTTTEYAPDDGRPHTAFEAPYAARANPRASVEIRTIAFFY
jgi:hypothetical protein